MNKKTIIITTRQIESKINIFIFCIVLYCINKQNRIQKINLKQSMSQQLKASNSNINHLLASRLHQPQTILQQDQQSNLYATVVQQRKLTIPQINPYKIPKYRNPLSQRSRKHRLMEQKNTQIQKTNRILFEKIRKIKLKNLYHSERKIQPVIEILDDAGTFAQIKYSNQIKLPSIPNSNNSQRTPSLTSVSTTSQHPKSSTYNTINRSDKLNSILEDRSQFVAQYFNDLSNKRKNMGEEKQLCVVVTENGWRVRVLQVGEERVLLVGKKGKEELTKKYLLSKIKAKLQNNLQEWVKYKFSFEE